MQRPLRWSFYFILLPKRGAFMQITEIEIEKLKPYENNAKTHPRSQIKNVAESIKEFGWQQPIVIDKNNVIIIGHCRYLAAKKLKLKTVPCAIAENLSEEEVNKLRLIDNKTNESDWDMELLTKEINSLDLTAFDIDWGVALEEPETEVVEDDFDVESAIPKEPKSKLGDVYLLGNHRLMCGDSTKEEDVDKLMNNFEADLLLTDPPYNVDYESKDGKKLENDNMASEEYKEFLIKAISNAEKHLKIGASFYIWHADKKAYYLYYALEQIGLTVRQCLIWKKNALVLGRQDYQQIHEPCLYGWKEGAAHSWFNDRKQTTVMDFDKPNRSELHPTMKPIKLFDYQIKNSSKKDDIVLDLFGGSGTTLICCEQSNRICYMMEFDPKYVDVIIERWETFTGKKAVKIA